MNSAKLVQNAALLTPLPMTVAVILYPATQLAPPKDLAAAVFFAMFGASVLMRSDGLHAAAFAGLAVLSGAVAVQAGLFISFAVVVLLLVVFDMVGLVKSLFGITRPKVDFGNHNVVSLYLGIVRKQAVRSLGVGFAAFLVSAAMLFSPIPELAFANPVAGSGILALASLLLILIAAGGPRVSARLFGRSQSASAA